FFQAEDGIRDRNVTGVQTCALPIWPGTLQVVTAKLPSALRSASPATSALPGIGVRSRSSSAGLVVAAGPGSDGVAVPAGVVAGTSVAKSRGAAGPRSWSQ